MVCRIEIGIFVLILKVKAMKKFLAIVSILTLGLVACSKNDEPEVKKVQADPADVALVRETVDQLTKALTAEDLAQLSYFIKLGDTPGTLYIDITKENISYLKGEVGKVNTENGPSITLNLLALDAAPVTGNILVYPLAQAIIETVVYKNDATKLAEAIALANQAVDVQVLGVYEVVLTPIQDPESGEAALVWCVDMGGDMVPLDQLIELLLIQLPAA